MKRSLFILLFAYALTACSAMKMPVPSKMTALKDANEYVLNEEALIYSWTSKPFTLQAKTRWRIIGQIDQGKIFSTTDQVVMVNGFNAHEAYIVVENDKMKGYYLTVDKKFVPSRVTKLSLTKEDR